VQLLGDLLVRYELLLKNVDFPVAVLRIQLDERVPRSLDRGHEGGPASTPRGSDNEVAAGLAITGGVLHRCANGLMGTNTQAAISRRQILADDDPLIAAAGRAWTPASFLTSRRTTGPLAEIESELRKDAARWQRYDDLRARRLEGVRAGGPRFRAACA
jgi:hypothetical protein